MHHHFNRAVRMLRDSTAQLFHDGVIHIGAVKIIARAFVDKLQRNGFGMVHETVLLLG